MQASHCETLKDSVMKRGILSLALFGITLAMSSAVFITITAIVATVLWDVGHAGWLGSEAVPTTVLTYPTVNIVPIHRSVLV